MADEIEEEVNQARGRCVALVVVALLTDTLNNPQEEYEEGEEGDEEELLDDEEHGGGGHEGLDEEEGEDEDEEGGQELELTEAQAAQMAQIARSLGLPGFGRMPVTVQGAQQAPPGRQGTAAEARQGFPGSHPQRTR